MIIETKIKTHRCLFNPLFYFSVKDATPYFLKYFLVYKFICARCISCYIGKTCHFITRINEHIKKDNSHVFQYLHNKEESFSSFDLNWFSIKIQQQLSIKQS